MWTIIFIVEYMYYLSLTFAVSSSFLMVKYRYDFDGAK